ncbi:kinesin motor domain containing protein [Listeria innocua FSL S4-378]|nr:kinesin motor domain containing protein [Listeria innocua FSL S4-378]
MYYIKGKSLHLYTSYIEQAFFPLQNFFSNFYPSLQATLAGVTNCS